MQKCPLLFSLMRRMAKIYDDYLRNLQQKFEYQQKRQTQKSLLRLRRKLSRKSCKFYFKEDWQMKKIHKLVMKKVNNAVRPSLSKTEKLRAIKKQKLQV